ncbi:histidine kinase [Vagococcus sp. BWB3-3]|uniref:Histidine kinase n=1 Tax=Vagococcus allomyrinae TaxID=2794353 RepID=A0A940P882_9ENTE|nr:histidine kinase [Vagococcus allomyrinae]MBP1039752.1 histidine kinase [Vagococcus allomyrinae]
MTSLKRKLLLSTSLLFLLLFIGLFFAINREITLTALPLNKQATQQLVSSKSKQINDWFSERISEIATLAEFSSRHNLTTADLFTETKAVEERQQNIYESIRLVNSKGVSKSWIAPSFSIQDRLYYQRLIASDFPYTVSNALHSKEGTHDIVIVLYRLPVPTSEDIQYIAAAINVDKMEQMAEELTIYDGVGELVNQPANSQSKLTSEKPIEKWITFNGHIELLPEWKITYTVSQRELLQTGLRIRSITIGLAAILFLVFIILLLFLLRAFVKPIENLNQTMTAVQAGNQLVRATITSADEIGQLGRQFNKMLDQVYATQQENIKGQIRLLQEQVKPHFLYNTLDTIQWLSAEGDRQGVENVIQSLSDYFRVGLNNGSEMTTLEKELQHVSSYLTIQEIRYEKQIAYSYDLDEGLLNAIVPHFLLQPLVENALYHGIRPLSTKGQQLIIKVNRDEKNIRLRISNTGLMPSIEKLKAIQDFLASDLTHRKTVGFGIYSIAYRLRLTYQEKATIMAAIQNEHFIVTIELPLEYKLKGTYL